MTVPADRTYRRADGADPLEAAAILRVGATTAVGLAHRVQIRARVVIDLEQFAVGVAQMGPGPVRERLAVRVGG